MPISSYSAVTGSALLVLLFVSDAYLGERASESRFDASFYESATYAPSRAEPAKPAERRMTRDLTPAARIREVFAQFVPNEGKRGKRYASFEAVIR